LIPTSDQLEEFQERLLNLDRGLAKLKGAEVTSQPTIIEIKSISKEWLRLSEALRGVDALPAEPVAAIDAAFKEVFQSTNSRARASSYRTKLKPVIELFSDRVVVPVIRHEGTPAQATARQLINEFATKVSVDEQGYLEEAARCLSVKCNRAAIILLWAAAVARLHGAVEKIGFNTYNAALDVTVQKKGNPFNKVSKQTISSLPELQRSRDFDLLVVGMGLWNYDLQVFDELEGLLGIRNNAAHPGMLKPSALDVQQYAAKLSTYVFTLVPL
jgi:hypothetical protein